MLVKIVNDQIAQQTLLNKAPNSFATAEEKMQYIRDTCLALHIEVSEFLQELPWKPWRKLTDQKYDQGKAADEIVDIFIFALNLWIHLGAYPTGQSGKQLIKAIIRKQHVNEARLYSGRNKTYE